MTDEAPLGGIAIEPAADTGAEISIAEAARAYIGAVTKKPDEPAESAEPATAETELSGEDNAAPEEAPGETADADPEENLPPVERPRSWSKDDDDWNALPRERQETIAAKERAREADINQRINKAAETAKAAEAKVAQAEQARQSYESRQAEYTKALETALQADFGDIQSLADVRKMQAEDPFRFQAWQVRQMELSTAQAERQQVDSRKAQEKQNESRTRKEREHALLIEKAPEFADAKKLKAAQDAAVELFREKGVNDDWFKENGENPLLDDHHFQLIVADALKYRDIQKAKTSVAAKSIPPVQRPGPARPAGNAMSEEIAALTRKLETTGDVKVATQLYALQERAARRRAS